MPSNLSNRLDNIAQRLLDLPQDKLQSFWEFIGGKGTPEALIDAIWRKAYDQTRDWPLVQRSYPYHHHGHVRAADKRAMSSQANQESWMAREWSRWEEIQHGGRVYEVWYATDLAGEPYVGEIVCVWSDSPPGHRSRRFKSLEEAQTHLKQAFAREGRPCVSTGVSAYYLD